MLPEIARRFRALGRAQRVRWAAMPLIGLVAAVLEALAGALVFAVLALLFEPTGAVPGRLVAFIRSAFPFAEAGSPVIALAAWAAGIHILKNVVVAGLTWWRARTAAHDSAELSTRLLRGYLAAPWSFHLRRSSAALTERLRDSPRPFFDVFESSAIILAEAAMIAGLVLVALLVAPWHITLMMAGLGLTLAVMLRLARRAHLRGGARTADLGASLYRHIQHGLGAAKEVTILGRGAHFADAYERDARAQAALDSQRAVLEAAPRLAVESAFVLGMLALVVAGSLSGNLASVLPVVSLYAYAGFRIVPAAHRIALQVNSLRWTLGASAALLEDLDTFAPAVRHEVNGTYERLEFHETLRADNLSFTYEGADAPVLAGVTLAIRRGESVAIAGATGAGKSTLVDILIGLLTPSSGQVTVDGRPIAANLRGWQRNIGYVPQAPFLLDDTLRRNIALGVLDAAIDEAAVRRAVSLARLDDVARRLPEGLDTPIGEGGIRLSGGERQRVAIARALYRDPALVVFDEATSSLDPGTEREIALAIDALRGDRTVIVIAHRLSTIQRCDRMFLLHGGRIDAAGTWADLATGSDTFRALAAI